MVFVILYIMAMLFSFHVNSVFADEGREWGREGDKKYYTFELNLNNKYKIGDADFEYDESELLYMLCTDPDGVISNHLPFQCYVDSPSPLNKSWGSGTIGGQDLEDVHELLVYRGDSVGEFDGDLKKQLLDLKSVLETRESCNGVCIDAFTKYCGKHSSLAICKDFNQYKDDMDVDDNGVHSCTLPSISYRDDNNSYVLNLELKYNPDASDIQDRIRFYPTASDSTSIEQGDYYVAKQLTYFNFYSIEYKDNKKDGYEKFLEEIEKKIKGKIDSGSNKKCNSLFTICQSVDESRQYYAELDLENNCPDINKKYTMWTSTVGSNHNKRTVRKRDEKFYSNKLFDPNGTFTIANCEELFGGDSGNTDLLNMLKLLVSITKILIPVILLVLGSLDFAKAIFAQDEGEIKKAQSKFIKRVIIAVVIFLIPSILQAILTIAHGIWPDIDPNLCGIL